MFSNLLYFLVALVIYSTSELFDNTQKFDNSIVINSIMLSLLFIIVCNFAFKHLKKRALKSTYENIDHLINNYISRLSILALIFFAINIYGFKLTVLFSGISFFNIFPTFEAILFLGLFLFYLIVIWNEAYRIQEKFFGGKVSKKDFIVSNVSFSLPALLPWLCLSMVADILGFLPWKPLKDFLQTPAGEVGYIALFLVAIAIFGPVLIKRIWNCKPLEQGAARGKIESICKNAGVKYSDILKWELFGGTMITAGVMGLVARFRYILVTPALLTSLTEEELEAVMLHEIGHVQRNHMVFYLLLFSGFIVCNFVFFEPVIFLLYLLEPVYSMFEMIGVDKATAHPILISFTLIGSFVIYFRFVFGFFMRHFERQADLHVYNFTEDASALISTFYKIASFSRQSIDRPNWHHYSIGQRIRFLEQCQQSPALIPAFHLRVKKLISVYFLVIVLIAGFGYSINFGAAKNSFDNFIAEKVLLQQMDIDPDNSDLYALVGDYYYGKKNYEKAIDSYTNVLKVAPENIHALNNLSWLFATCPDKRYRNNTKALEYAQKALEYTNEAFVIDTYAEALFINNDIQKAVAAAKEALNISTDKKKYYQSQLKKFEEILNTNR